MKKFIFSGIFIFITFCISLNAQELQGLTVIPTVTYLSPTSETGAISLNVTPGSGNYTYDWELNNAPLAETGPNLSGLQKGIYRVTVTDLNDTEPSDSSIPLKYEGRFNLYYTGIWDSFDSLDIDNNVYTRVDDPANPQGYGAAISNNMFETNSWRYFEFNIYGIESNTTIGFVNANNLPNVPSDILYGIRLLKNADSTKWQVIESGLGKGPITSFDGGIKLRVMINHTVKRIRYYVDDILKLQTSYAELPQMQLPQMHVGMLVETGPGISLNWNTNLLYKNLEVNSNYAKLKKKLDGAFAKVFSETQADGSTASILKFTYSERYNVVGGENNKAKCIIYNWKRDNMDSTELNNNYGKNWQEIDVSNLPSGFYTLEVTGINKDEKYYLRFRK